MIELAVVAFLAFYEPPKGYNKCATALFALGTTTIDLVLLAFIRCATYIVIAHRKPPSDEAADLWSERLSHVSLVQLTYGIAKGVSRALGARLDCHSSTEIFDGCCAAFAVFDEIAKTPGKAVLFSETGAQHFKASDRRGYGTGEWEHRDKSADTHCTCSAIEDFNVNVRNAVLWGVLDGAGRTKYPHLHILPFYNLTRPRYRWHFGNCTQRPNGWNYYTCCDVRRRRPRAQPPSHI
mgnify:CR=1 FL=1